MGVKKIARPINKAKNLFLKWLKDNDAESIDEFEGGKDAEYEWDYYRSVDGFIGDNFYLVYFTIWEGNVNIDYSDDENKHDKLSIDEFLEMITN